MRRSFLFGLLGLVAACGERSESREGATRIMPLGDSITQADAEHDSYRRPLFKTLELQGREVDFVGSLRSNYGGGPPRRDFDLDHEGHWGWRVDEVLEEIEGWAESEEPDVLLVHLGSNDVFQGQSVSSTLEELSRLIDVVRGVRPDAAFFVAQIISTSEPGVNRAIEELNAGIALLSSKSTERSLVRVVDFAGFDPARMTYDGVHPSAEGEIHMADRWLEALEGHLDESERRKSGQKDDELPERDPVSR
jgi:acyl-CoA thioesterase I